MEAQPKAAARAEADTIFAAIRAAGAQPVEADVLIEAGTALDLYGEDIRARAYITQDPIRGEMMLRPDFTLPVVQMHMAEGAEPARYTYLGEVFRKQDHRGPRAAEYLQVGYEVFERDDTPGADAEVFALFAGLLAPLGLRAATGDIGLITAAVAGLATTDRRKAALLRHVWRPRRFRALLDRFAGRSAVPETRARLLAAQAAGAALPGTGAPQIGLRGPEEVAERVAALAEDAATPPISVTEMELIDDLMAIRQKSPAALGHLRDLSVDLPALTPAVDRMARRLEALAKRGIDVAALDFEASYGRTTLEYYDGFVFGFYAEARPDLPPVASGGRYDALTRVIGQGRSIPAVGGVIRPGLVAALKGGR